MADREPIDDTRYSNTSMSRIPLTVRTSRQITTSLSQPTKVRNRPRPTTDFTHHIIRDLEFDTSPEIFAIDAGLGVRERASLVGTAVLAGSADKVADIGEEWGTVV